MAGFSFPPPPPPPPKATSQDASSATNQTQPGGYGHRPSRGGGDRGRGRGRGRGNQGRGGCGGFGRGGATNTHAAMNYSPQFNHSFQQQHASAQPNTYARGPPFNLGALPAGGHINPAFVNSHLPAPQPWFSQVPSSQTAGKAPPAPTTPSSYRPPSGSRVANKPKMQTAPPVPSFGFALPTVTPQVLPNGSGEKGKPKKRKTNVLGLTPRGDVYEDSEEDDADEEAKFNPAGGALQFEYKGQSSTLKSAEDIAAWIEQRKKRFPTKERVAQKQKEEEEKRRAREGAGAEKRLRYPQKDKDAKKRKRKDDDDAQDKATMKAERLREKLRKAEEAVAKAKAKLESRSASEKALKKNLGINYDSTEQSNDQDSSSLAESSSEVSSESDSDSSSSLGSSSDGDVPPEEESSAKRPIRVNLPNRKSLQTTSTRLRRDKDKEVPTRTTLRERMAEQERRQDAEVVLRFIKMLGEKGLLD